MRITVVGSINLDFVARAPHLPAPGETVTGAALSRHITNPALLRLFITAVGAAMTVVFFLR